MLGDVAIDEIAPHLATVEGPGSEVVAVDSKGSNRSDRTRVVRRVAAMIAAAAALLLVYQPVVGGLVASNRQRHLSADFATARPVVHEGEAVAVLQVPRLGINRIVVLGTGIDDLRGGPGVMAGGVLPGQPGVSVIVGHRSAYGAPFERLDELVVGDLLSVHSRNLQVVEFTVTAVGSAPDGSVDMSDFGAVDPARNARLVLAAGTGDLFSDQALFVTAAAITPGVAPAPPGSIDVVPARADLVSSTTWLALMSALAGVLALGLIRSRHWRSASWCLVPVWVVAWVLTMMSLEPLLSPLR